MLQKLMKWIQDGSSTSKSPGSASSEAKSVAAIEPSEKPAKKDKSQDAVTAASDSQVKLESPRCDLHPLYILRETVIDAVLEEPPARKIKSFRCAKDSCTRHYSFESGYFDFVPNEPVRFEGIGMKPNCTLNHDRRCMILTKLNGTFMWACPESGCPATAPYEDGSAREVGKAALEA